MLLSLFKLVFYIIFFYGIVKSFEGWMWITSYIAPELSKYTSYLDNSFLVQISGFLIVLYIVYFVLGEIQLYFDTEDIVQWCQKQRSRDRYGDDSHALMACLFTGSKKFLVDKRRDTVFMFFLQILSLLVIVKFGSFVFFKIREYMV